MASLLKIENKDCLYDIVECVLGSVDHKVFDVQEAFNTVYDEVMSDEISGDDDNAINYKKEKYLPLIKLILDQVNPESLDLEDILNQACRDCSSDVVKLLLENTDHKQLDVKKAMNIIYNLWVHNKGDNDEGAMGREIEKQYNNEEEKEEKKIGEHENDEKEEQEMEEHEGEKDENEVGDKEDEDKEGEKQQ
ncbi:uncharacterized protein LOC127737193 [Mytilus californianus]|uniref:uncharacterized protein LOC127737193 n=1 Tax=Mytilus californianus TaxID=6549 RepID=UPI0022477260|nr:uncharacterized protein LOC127737193 [Mytilus californianus]